jgi:cupin 2 domain-containing protein
VPQGKGEAEWVDLLAESADTRIDRIVSTGEANPPGFWYDQADDEFVVLLAGAAELRFEDGDRRVQLKPGDWVDIPAHVRHRVEFTQADPPTVWLTVYRGRGRTRAVGSAISGSSGQ